MLNTVFKKGYDPNRGGFKKGHPTYNGVQKGWFKKGIIPITAWRKGHIIPKGEDNWSWKGGRYINKHGYVLLKRHGHRLADGNDYVLEHRLVIEEQWNCCVLSWCHGHHRDGNKQNNVWYNLWPMTNRQHRIHHNMGNKYGVKRSALVG